MRLNSLNCDKAICPTAAQQLEMIQKVLECASVGSPPYIVEYGGPSLHGDALEDGEDSKQDVVELSDAVVWADPGIAAVIISRTLTHSAGELQHRGVHRLVF